MKEFRGLTLIVLAFLFANQGELRAGKYNSVLTPGKEAPGFLNLPGVDGKRHSISDYRMAKVKVLVFTCNSCPYAVDYEDRLNEFQKKYCQSGKVALIAINSNLTPADSMQKMKLRAKEKNFRFDYLFDESQQLAEKYGALRTPEFYVLDVRNQVVYMGAFDDNTKTDQVKQKYVENAVQAVLNGNEIGKAETPPIGCLIRFKRSRRRK